jgi:hypothetical protein
MSRKDFLRETISSYIAAKMAVIHRIGRERILIQAPSLSGKMGLFPFGNI